MGSFLGKLFIDPTTLGSSPEDLGYGLFQTCFLGACYAYVLSYGSNMISEGSELLLLIPKFKDIVGSVVLPVLGAVPDGAIVLFSGLGPDAEKQVAVGIGALAGSTIMLLTIPWFLSVWAGRVDLVNGHGRYKKRPGEIEFEKLTPGVNLFSSGVEPKSDVSRGALVMMLTAIPYIIIQGPATFYDCDRTQGNCNKEGEKWWAFGGMLTCFFLFCGYLYYCVKSKARTEIVNKIVEEKISGGSISVAAAFGEFLAEQEKLHKNEHSALLSDKDQIQDKLFTNVCRKLFCEVDKDESGNLDVEEFRYLVYKKLKLTYLSEQDFQDLLAQFDKDGNKSIDEDEFCQCLRSMILKEKEHPQRVSRHRSVSVTSTASKKYSSYQNDKNRTSRINDQSESEDEEDEDEEEDLPEVPVDLLELPKDEQLNAILKKSIKTMLLGTILVLVFSDPMVDVFASLGERTRVPVFFISFVLAPLASNASELIAAYSYALKKTRSTITISMETLQGAACMNNTFCLGIFLALVFFLDLPWVFTAETILILFVEIMLALVSMRKVQSLALGFFVLTLFPVSIILVNVLENAGLN